MRLEEVREVLDTRFGGIIAHGSHCEDGEACVRELRAVVLRQPWNDHPDGVTASPTDRACQVLNDANWSSDAARTEACLPLALLSEATAPAGWVSRYAELTIRRVLPECLRVAARIQTDANHKKSLNEAADRCEREGTKAAAYAAAYAAANAANAAANAAAYAVADAVANAAANAANAAANAAAYAAANAANAAANAAAYAAAYAADAVARADSDRILKVGVSCLLEAHGVTI